MKLDDAATMARNLMNQHGLQHVPFGWTRKTRQFGVCLFARSSGFEPYTAKMICLSSVLVQANTDEHVRDTILHEIAHALVGPQAGHGYTWQSKARELGCDPSPRCGANVKMAPGKYFATCPCGRSHEAYRMPTRAKVCRDCRAKLVYQAR